MNIGIDARVLYCKQTRGMGRYLFELIKHLSELRKNDHFYLFYEEDVPSFFSSIPNISEIRFQQRGYRFRLWEQVRLPIEIIRNKINLFHSPANSLPLCQPRNTILTMHDASVFALDDPSFGDQNYLRRVLPIALKKVKKVITVSNYSKSEILKYFPFLSDKLAVTYEGVDPFFQKVSEKKISEIKKKYGIQDRYILSVAAVAPKKQTSRVLQIFSKIKKELLNSTQLVLVGNQYESEDPWMKLAIKLNIGSQVKVLSFIPNEDLRALYSGAILYVYFSLYEGFGLPILEAMSCGVPVLSSNKSSLPEVVGNAGILVNPKDEKECSRQMELLLANESLCADLQQKGFEQIKKFSWEKMAKETSEIYDEVMKG